MTDNFGPKDIEPLRLLQDAFGDDAIILDDGSKESVPYRLLAEFSVGGTFYAVLQSEAMEKNDEVDIFHIVPGENGPELQTVVDDDEWENVAELYDEMTFSFDGNG
jgi:uncharacterized protein YrzB (UPF0473 family)